MEIKFVRAPCEFVELEAWDAMGVVIPAEYKKIQLFRLDSSENEIGTFVTPIAPQLETQRELHRYRRDAQSRG